MTIESNIIPRLGNYKVEKITSDIIQEELINELMHSGLSRSTIKKCYDALNSFYKQCIIDRKVIYNPISGVVMPAAHNFNTKKARTLTSAEIVRFEETATKKFLSGCRTIQLCDKAVAAIKQHIKLNYTGDDDAFVFASAKGEPLMYRNFRKSINAVYKAADVDATGFHILRHTMASLMFAKKIDIKYISAFLGHSGVQITYDTYVHIIKELEEKSIKELDKL